jgi:hypothetical protein
LERELLTKITKVMKENFQIKSWHCPLYKNKCKIRKESHTLDIAGKTELFSTFVLVV